MKKIFGIISAIVTFISLNSFCEPELVSKNIPSMIAITSLSDVAAADSMTDGAVKLAENDFGPVVEINSALSDDQMKEIENFLPVKIVTDDETPINTAADIIKYIVSVLGGLLSSIILFFLNKKYPNIFPSKKIKNYVDYPKK